MSLSHSLTPSLIRRRVFPQHCRWPNRAGLEVTAAIGAHTIQFTIHAILAERALEAADHGLR